MRLIVFFFFLLAITALILSVKDSQLLTVELPKTIQQESTPVGPQTDLEGVQPAQAREVGQEDPSGANVSLGAGQKTGEQTQKVIGDIESAVYNSTVDLNSMLAYMLSISAGELEGKPDFDYWDDEVTAFKFKNLPEGIIAHFGVNQAGYENQAGESCKALRLTIKIKPSYEPYIKNGALRTGFDLKLLLGKTVDGKLDQLSLIMESEVDNGEEFGLNYFSGIHNWGVVYATYFNKKDPICYPFGLVDGNMKHWPDFPAQPCILTDGGIDSALVDKLNTSLSKLFSSLKE